MSWDLPHGWRWTPVGEALTPVKRQVQADQIHDDWIYIGLEHVQSGTGEFTGVHAGDAGIKSNKYTFESGDLLYGKLRPNLRKCVVVDISGVCSTDLVPLRPVDPDAAHFVALQLRSEPFTASVMRMIGGANLPRISMNDLFSLSLPTPPSADQRRLYALARGVGKLRDKQREVEAAVNQTTLAATAVALGLVGLPIRGLTAVAQPEP